jgi:di/tricarboxylate transporter
MIIGRFFRKKGSFAVSLGACLAFVLAAILAWDLPLSEALRFAVASLLALLLIMLAAAVTVVGSHLIARLWRKLITHFRHKD